MRRTFAVLACLAVLPSLALAQRGTRTQADRYTPMFEKDEVPRGPALRPRDLEDQSPIRLLMDKRKDLKLTDAQVDALKAAESPVKDKNAPLLKTVDSLLRDMKPAMNPTDESRAKNQSAARGLMSTIAEIRANYDEAVKPFLAMLDADQQAKANELLAKAKEENEKATREKTATSGGKKG